MGSLLDRVRRVIGRERAGPLLGLLAGALLIFALPAQAAFAAQLSYSGRTFTYTDEGGENNTLVVYKLPGAPGQIVFDDQGTTITAIDPLGICSGSGTSTVSCDNDSTGAGGPAFNLLDISVGDLEDTVHNNTNIKSHIDGGDDDDVLFGGTNDDIIDGGDGDDEIHGDKGNDELSGGPGDDLIGGDEGDDVIFGDDGRDDLSGNDGADIIDTGLNTGAGAEVVLGGDGDDVVFFRYKEAASDVVIGEPKNFIKEVHININGGPEELRLLETEQLHIFNEGSGAGKDRYDIKDLSDTPLQVLVLQSPTSLGDPGDADALKAGATITAEGTTGPDHIVLDQHNDIGTLLPRLSMAWGSIIFRGPPAGVANSTFITVNSGPGDDHFDVDLSLPLGNEVGLTLNGGTGKNSVTFSKPDNDEFTLDLSDPDEPQAGTVTAGSAFGDVAFTDILNVSLDGKGHDVAVTLITPEGTDDIVYTPGKSNGSGTAEVNSFPVGIGPDLIIFDFYGIGTDGSLTFDNAGGDGDNLEYHGRPGSAVETWTLLDTGEIDLTGKINSVKVFTPGIAFLSINAGDGKDTFDLTDGPVPFDTVDLNGEDGDDTFKIVGGQTAVITVDGGQPGASDTLSLSLPSGDIVVDLEAETITGFGVDPISISGIEHLVINGGGNTPLTVLGTAADDEINFTPSGTDSGKIEFIKPTGLDLKDLTFTNLSGDLEIDGDGGNNTIRTIGTPGDDKIVITAGEPDADHTTTQVGTKKLLITENDNTALLAVDAGAGKDTITFNADCSIPLHLFIDGNIPGGTTASGDELIIATPNDSGAKTKTFAGHDPSSGNVDVCTQSGGKVSSVEFERIERINGSAAGGNDGLDHPAATQPDGVFVSLADSGSNTNRKKLTTGKTRGENVYGALDSGKGGQNVSGPTRGQRISSTSGKLTIPLLIQNDGPSGPDSYVVEIASETISGVSGNSPDPGVTVKVKDQTGSFKDISDDVTVGPIDSSSQLASAIQITTNGAKKGRHKLVINIFSVNGGADEGDNKFVDSITVYFTVAK